MSTPVRKLSIRGKNTVETLISHVADAGRVRAWNSIPRRRFPKRQRRLDSSEGESVENVEQLRENRAGIKKTPQLVRFWHTMHAVSWYPVPTLARRFQWVTNW